MPIYEPLNNVQNLSNCTCLQTGQPDKFVTLENAAVDVMTDLRHHQAFTIDKNASIVDATNEMKLCGVHMLLVVQQQQVLGLISSEDLIGSKPVKVAQEKSIAFNQVKVSMVMQPLKTILAIDKTQLHLARVGHIVETLKAHNQHYALAVETHENTQQHTITGIFSLAEIGTLLNMNLLDKDLRAHNLAELQKRL